MNTKRRANVLIVEDDLDYQRHYRGVLAKDFNVDQASTADEAIERAARKYYSVAIVDLSLRGEATKDADGLRVVEHLSGRKEPTAIILLTAQATVSIARDAFVKYGAFELVEKQKLSEVDLPALISRGSDSAAAKLEVTDCIEFFRGQSDEAMFVDEFLRSLKPRGGYTGMKDALASVGNELWPLRHSRTHPGLRVQVAEKFAEGRFWSRQIGSAVEIRVRSGEGDGMDMDDSRTWRVAGLNVTARQLDDGLSNYSEL